MTMAGHGTDSLADTYACKVAAALANKPLTKLVLPRESLAVHAHTQDEMSLLSLTIASVPGGVTSKGTLSLGLVLRERPLPVDLKLEGVDLRDCWKQLGLPEGASEWGNGKILAYWQELRESGAVVQPRVKLMLVGSGNVGKSTLMHRLRTGEYDDRIPFTDGVDVRDWVVKTDDDGDVQIVAWDFGGQPIYMASHPLFFTADCIYLVIWNPRALQLRLDKELAAYVTSVRCRAGRDAPIVFVSTHADAGVRQDITAALATVGESNARHFHVSSKTGDGVDDLQGYVRALAVELGGKKQHAIPTSFVKLEQELVALRPKAPCGVLPFTQASAASVADLPSVQEVASKCGIADMGTLELALEVLVERGRVLHYQTDELKDIVFADPQQLAELLATTITCEEGKCARIRRGVLEHGSSLDALWANFPSKLRPSMLNLLYHCEVAYPMPDGTGSLVPAMLPDDAPSIKDAWLEQGARMASMEITVDELHPDFFPRFLVRTSRFAHSGSSWRHGVLLQRGEERAVVELDQLQGKVTIQCAGTFPMGLRGLIYQAIEHLLAQWFKTVACKEMLISCPVCCKWACSSGKLSRKLQGGATQMECQECDAIISIADLAPGIVPLNEAELVLKQDLAAEESRPNRLELMRRDLVRVLGKRLQDTTGLARYPLLWAVRCGQNGHDAVVGVCEHPEGWHVVSEARIQGLSEADVGAFKMSEYWAVVGPALQKLMSDAVEIDAAVGHNEGDPLTGTRLAGFLSGLFEKCAAGALRRVVVREGAPQWLCAEHALLHSAKKTCVEHWEWKVEHNSGELLAYDATSNTAIERAFQAGQSELKIEIASHSFRILNLTAPSDSTTRSPEELRAHQALEEMGFPCTPLANQLVRRNPTNLNAVVTELLARREQGEAEVHDDEAGYRCVQEDEATKVTRAVFRRTFDPPYPVPPPLPFDMPIQRALEPFKLYEVGRDSPLWQRVCRRVRESLPDFEVTRLQQVVNSYLWANYCVKSYALASGCAGGANERELFHVSKNLEAILKGTNNAGFDPRLKERGGSEYGNGVYFAQHIAYCVSYSQGWLFEARDPPADEVQVLLALVSLGDCKDFGPLCSSSSGDSFADDQGVARGLKSFWHEGNHRNRGPRKEMSDEHSALYDSVCGTEANLAWSRNAMLKEHGARLGQQYVVFHPDQSYPSVLITLRHV